MKFSVFSPRWPRPDNAGCRALNRPAVRSVLAAPPAGRELTFDIARNMAIFMAMKIKVNIADLKNRLSEYLKRVEQGDEIAVCKRNVPMARIGPFPEGGVEVEGSQSLRQQSLSEVNGWLEDDDPFFRVMGECRNLGRACRRDPFRSSEPRE